MPVWLRAALFVAVLPGAVYDPPRVLVTEGLYGLSRNPMYIGVLLAVLGQAIWWWSVPVLFYAAFIALLFHLRVLLYEEPVLKREFGDDYAQYCARVGRWLPRMNAPDAQETE